MLHRTQSEASNVGRLERRPLQVWTPLSALGLAAIVMRPAGGVHEREHSHSGAPLKLGRPVRPRPISNWVTGGRFTNWGQTGSIKRTGGSEKALRSFGVSKPRRLEQTATWKSAVVAPAGQFKKKCARDFAVEPHLCNIRHTILPWGHSSRRFFVLHRILSAQEKRFET
jgi:hypothetical protein